MLQKASQYYYVWIEGIGPRTGEKVKCFDGDRIVYTTYVTKTMRVHRDDIPEMREKLRRCGIAEWCIESSSTFIRTSYVPKGTLWKG